MPRHRPLLPDARSAGPPAARPLPTRIGIVAAGPHPPGGQGIQAGALADGLRREGHDVILIPINPRFPPGVRWLRRCPLVRTLVNQALYLPRLIALRRAGVVHVFAAAYWSFLLGPLPALLAARALRRRAVLVYHSGEGEDHLARWGVLIHPWLRLADEIVVPSDYLRESFARHGYPARVVPNVVDTSRFPYVERLPLRPRLLSTRNLEPHYRVDDTLRAFALLQATRPDAELTVAGSGSEERPLRRLASSLSEGGVRFLGRIAPSEMPGVYRRSDIFVNSSTVDNQPVSVLEAFAAGLPVVSTAAGGIPRLIRHGETGLLVPPGDPAAMAAAVASLLGDPDRARLMTRRARADAERHTWTRVRQDWLDASALSAA